MLADNISSRLQIANRNTKPETQSRHGRLYIHWWNTPSALAEIAFLQGDAGLLREYRPEFGRAIAQATLQYLEMDPNCADWAVPEGWHIATYFPEDSQTNRIGVRNDGLLEWGPFDYSLLSVDGTYGADVQYLLPSRTAVNEVAYWEILVEAPKGPGVYRQEWQLLRGSESVGKKTTVYIIVVPEQARQLKEDIDLRIEELRQQGELEIKDFIDSLEKEALQWVAREIFDLNCLKQAIPMALVLVALTLFRREQV